MEGTEEKRQKLAEMMDKLAGEDIMVAFCRRRGQQPPAEGRL